MMSCERFVTVQVKAGDKLMVRENIPLSKKCLVENGLTGKNHIPVV